MWLSPVSRAGNKQKVDFFGNPVVQSTTVVRCHLCGLLHICCCSSLHTPPAVPLTPPAAPPTPAIPSTVRAPRESHLRPWQHFVPLLYIRQPSLPPRQDLLHQRQLPTPIAPRQHLLHHSDLLVTLLLGRYAFSAIPCYSRLRSFVAICEARVFCIFDVY